MLFKDYQFNTYRFNRGSKKFAFDFYNLIVSQIDEITDCVFDCIEEDKGLDDAYKQFSPHDVDNVVHHLQVLANKGIFFSKERVEVLPSGQYEVGYFSLPPVHQCNLRCKYCFADAGRNYKGEVKAFSKDLIDKAMEFIYFDFFKDCTRYRIDFVSGGEPLLNFENVRYINEVGNRLFERTGKPLETWLCTNGTRINPDILDFMNVNKIGLGISIDGDKDVHDSVRVDMEGNGTYDRVIESINGILNNDKYSSALKEIWGLVVVTGKTNSLIDIVKHHKALGLKSIQMKVVRSKKDKEYSLNPANIDRIKKLYSEFIDFLKDEVLNNRAFYLKMILNDNDFLGKIIRRLILRQAVIYRCMAGKNKISITAEGDIYPCDSFVGYPEYRMGNIFSGINENMRKRFINATIYNRDKCRECWARIVCGGDCYHNSYLVTGKIEDPDALICELTKHVTILSLEFVDFIRQNNPQMGKYFCKFLDMRRKVSV